jgi:hypothetical protein
MAATLPYTRSEMVTGHIFVTRAMIIDEFRDEAKWEPSLFCQREADTGADRKQDLTCFTQVRTLEVGIVHMVQ